MPAIIPLLLNHRKDRIRELSGLSLLTAFAYNNTVRQALHT